MSHESQSQFSYSQSQPLFDSGVPSSGRMAHWSQSSNSQPSSQPAPRSHLSRATLLAHNAGTTRNARPASDSGRTNTSQSRMTMKDFFSVKKQRTSQESGSDRHGMDASAAAEIAKQCANQVREATEACKVVLEEHSQTQKEILSTQANSVFEELSNHCKIVATEVKLRDGVNLELSNLKKTIELREQELILNKRQLEDLQTRELRMQKSADDSDKEKVLSLQSNLMDGITHTNEQSKQLKQTTITVKNVTDSLAKTASEIAGCLSAFRPLLDGLRDAVTALTNIRPTNTIIPPSCQAAGTSTEVLPKCSITTSANKIPEELTKKASAGSRQVAQSDSNTSISEDSSLFFDGFSSPVFNPSKTSIAPSTSSSVSTRISSSRKVESSMRQAQTASSNSDVSSKTTGRRTLVSGCLPSTRFTNTPITTSRNDIFELAICNTSTSSDSEDDADARRGQVQRRKTPLQFITSSKRSHHLSEESPATKPTANRRASTKTAPPAKRPSHSPGHERTPVRPTKHQPSSHTRSSSSSSTSSATLARGRNLASPAPYTKSTHASTKTTAATVSSQRESSSQFDWTPDPAAELFDSLFKSKQGEKKKNQRIATPSTQSICAADAPCASQGRRSQGGRRKRR
ncbi:uncharacterized protein LOC135808230 isoform X2 [Sycon ciliatum]